MYIASTYRLQFYQDSHFLHSMTLKKEIIVITKHQKMFLAEFWLGLPL